MLKQIFRIFIVLILLFGLARAEVEVVAHAEVFQGRSFIVFLVSPETYSNATAHFNGQSVPFFDYENGKRAIIGTMPELKPGTYPLKIIARTRNDRLLTSDHTIEVCGREYPKVSFWLKPAKKKLLKRDIVTEGWVQIEKAIMKYTPQKLWSGKFLRPVPGIVTMDFGVKEYINNKRRGRHRGVDFRAKIGTPVKAPERGKIVFAKHLAAFGGTAVIDHGQGIHTLYFHLSKVLLPTGTMLKKGQVFAKTGNSGISSGPHLHWGLSVHNVRSDPMQWVQTVMP